MTASIAHEVNQPLAAVVANADACVAWLSRPDPNLVEARAAAERYASIAPAVPHARQMPSHIYSMVGMWEESIASNASALEIQPDYYHAADFSVYAHLQLAQDAKAKALIEKAPPGGTDSPRFGG